jgi:hypothetical protein
MNADLLAFHKLLTNDEGMNIFELAVASLIVALVLLCSRGLGHVVAIPDVLAVVPVIGIPNAVGAPADENAASLIVLFFLVCGCGKSCLDGSDSSLRLRFSAFDFIYPNCRCGNCGDRLRLGPIQSIQIGAVERQLADRFSFAS